MDNISNRNEMQKLINDFLIVEFSRHEEYKDRIANNHNLTNKKIFLSKQDCEYINNSKIIYNHKILKNKNIGIFEIKSEQEKNRYLYVTGFNHLNQINPNFLIYKRNFYINEEIAGNRLESGFSQDEAEDCSEDEKDILETGIFVKLFSQLLKNDVALGFNNNKNISEIYDLLMAERSIGKIENCLYGPDVIPIFNNIFIFKISDDSQLNDAKFLSDDDQYLSDRVCQIFGILILETNTDLSLDFEEPCKDIIVKLIYNDIGFVDYSNILSGIFSLNWTDLFLAIYRQLEVCFPILYYKEIYSKLNVKKLDIQDFSIILEDEMNFRPPEKDSIKKIINEVYSKNSELFNSFYNVIKNDGDENYPYILDNYTDLTEEEVKKYISEEKVCKSYLNKIADKFYSIRNSIAHGRKKFDPLRNDLKKLNDNGWNTVIVFATTLLIDINLLIESDKKTDKDSEI